MKCKCGGESCVMDSRQTQKGYRRIRSCTRCGYRWITYELTQERVEQINSELGKYRLIGQIIGELMGGDA